MVERFSESAPGEYASILRRRWRWLAAVLVLAIGSAVAYLAVAPKMYAATASVLVTPSIGLDPGNSSSGRTSADVNLDTEAQIVRSTPVAAAAAELLRTGQPTTELVKSVSVSVPPNTTVLAISFQAPSATGAMEGAHAFAQAYLDTRLAQAKGSVESQIAAIEAQIASQQKQLREVSARIAEAPVNSPDRAADEAQRAVLVNQIQALNARLVPLNTTEVSVGSILTDAVLPGAPTSPDRMMVMASALALGVVLGLGLALLVDRLDRRVRRVADVASAGAEVLVRTLRPGRTAAIAAPSSREAGLYTELRVAMLAGLPASRGAIMVAPVGLSTGGTVVAANLAVSVARTGVDTILVSTDPDSPAARLLGLPAGGPSLADALQGTLAHYRRNRSGSPALLPAGDTLASLSDQLQGAAMEKVLTQLHEQFDVVLIESPPLDQDPLGLALAGGSDLVLVVAQERRTRRAALHEAIRRLRSAGARVSGAVLLGPPSRGEPAVVTAFPGAAQAWTVERPAATKDSPQSGASRVGREGTGRR